MPDQPPADPTEEELWRPIPWANGRYEVSSLGRVRSSVRGSGGKPGLMSSSPTGPYGHQKVVLHPIPHVRKQPLVHALVMEAFVGPRPPGAVIDHIDFDPRNNRLTNLRYVTVAENNRHSADAGRMKGNGHKLNEADVLAIREATGKQRDIAKRFGICQMMVSLIKRRKAWSHV